MKAYTYIEKGRFELIDKPKPQIQNPKDAIVRVTLGSICTLACVLLKTPKKIIVCTPEECRRIAMEQSGHAADFQPLRALRHRGGLQNL